MSEATSNARGRFTAVLKSRRMMRPGEEWVIDTNLNSYARELVAATLRTIAEQVRSEEDRADLLVTAAQVQQATGSDCCPLCQEVVCDTGCPLAASRATEHGAQDNL